MIYYLIQPFSNLFYLRESLFSSNHIDEYGLKYILLAKSANSLLDNLF